MDCVDESWQPSNGSVGLVVVQWPHFNSLDLEMAWMNKGLRGRDEYVLAKYSG